MQKKYFWLLIGSAFLPACNHGHVEGDNSICADSDSIFASDSIDADTLPLDDVFEKSPMPITVDELFDDFIFAFDQSNSLQRQRTHFPLPVTDENGNCRYIHKQDWKHRTLFPGHEFCTAFFNYSGQMQMTTSTEGKWAEVENIDLEQKEISRLHFDRDSLGRWILTGEKAVAYESHLLAGFFDFYQQFISDSTYQIRHVAKSLRYVSSDEDDEESERVEGFIDADQWFEFAPELPKHQLTNILYGQTYNNPNRLIMQIRGLGNGMQNLLVFQLQHHQWILTSYEN
ncbi:MAG: DUF4348 domain-containing protein [Bacteroidaceae bacterium]|nr:DUF4348 domain-containing protein [Bacteroidaceae bacterium]